MKTIDVLLDWDTHTFQGNIYRLSRIRIEKDKPTIYDFDYDIPSMSLSQIKSLPLPFPCITIPIIVDICDDALICDYKRSALKCVIVGIHITRWSNIRYKCYLSNGGYTMAFPSQIIPINNV